ncbi:complement C3-like isoform 2-T2 [Menidia menidia]
MGSNRKIPSVFHLVVFSTWIFQASGSPLEIMSAPSLLRAGTPEKIFVEIQDCEAQGEIAVQINVMDHPDKIKNIASTSVTLRKEENYQGFGSLTINPLEFSKDPNTKQYVYLQAKFPSQVLEKVVLVSFQSGYIFIQTDKNIYNPNSMVSYRVFGLTSGMESVNNKEDGDVVGLIEIKTPDGITVSSDPISFRSGILQGTYTLPNIVNHGLWKVEAKFRNNPQQIFATEFEVKDYVLPKFEIKMTPESSFFYVDSESLTVNIRAKYFSGDEVDGTAFVMFGVVFAGSKTILPSSLQRIPIVRGDGQVQLKREHITQTFPNIAELVGYSIYVCVTVLSANGHDLEKAESGGVKIITSPYSIHFTRTPKHFLPGMPFDITFEVLTPDDTPAENVPIVVNPGGISGTTSSNGITQFTINTRQSSVDMRVTVTTQDPKLPNSLQATASMTIHPFQTKSNNYIQIGVDQTVYALGDSMRASIFLSRPDHHKELTYLLLSKGHLVEYGRYKMSGEVLLYFIFPITKDMLPSFRIVAYVHTNSDEVISDSIWVDVKDSCVGTLKLETARSLPIYEPRRFFGLKITGDAEASVGLVAVDKRTLALNNKNRLTQKKIWDTVENFDIGCTRGRGKDSMNVFHDAGLLFVTRTSQTPDRTDVTCPASSRRKRGTTVINFKTKLMSQYADKEPRECCLDGMRTMPFSNTCERRSEYVENGPACVEAFINCCQEMEQRMRRREGLALQARSKRSEDDYYMDRNEILTRTTFPERWLWQTVNLGPCPPQDRHCKSTKMINFPLPDTITTWQISGISLSSHGICVADPIELSVRKNFFIDLSLPYSAVVGEQLEIKAILHNNDIDTITVRVDLMAKQDVCSAAYNQRVYSQEVRVEPESSRSVSFIIMPLTMADIPIEVKAAVKDSYSSDGIKKMLRVVPASKLVTNIMTVTLNPAAEGVDGKQEKIIKSNIPLTDIAPNTPAWSTVYVAARHSSQKFEGISGDSMGPLIVQPSGSGEENMAAMTLPVIATVFLDKTDQWSSIGFKKRKEALEYILKGYQNEMAFRKADGSFSASSTSQSSTWLTANVAKVFAMAHELVSVDRTVICDAIKFIILNRQEVYGAFNEEGNLIHASLNGGVASIDADASLTAFCLVALQETEKMCSGTVSMMSAGIERAVNNLEHRLPTLVNAYTVTVASYALANQNKLNKAVLFQFAAPDRSHWPIRAGDVYTLEATAYALLALVKAKAFQDAKPVVKWLTEQQRVNGGYGSPQATMMVHQAIAEHWTSLTGSGTDLAVQVLLPDKRLVETDFITEENRHVTRIRQFEGVNRDARIAATGRGEAIVKLASMYYSLPLKKEGDCDKLDMTVQILPVAVSDQSETYKLKVEVVFKDPERDSFPSVLDVTLPTGFIFNTEDLTMLAQSPGLILENSDLVSGLSDRGSLIIHLAKVSRIQPLEISLKIHQVMKVRFSQPAVVSVYEYNDRKPCVRFYHPKRSSTLLKLRINDNYVCAEENCGVQKKENVPDDSRIQKACETSQIYKVTFVYKVRVEEFTESFSTDNYKMRIVTTIKEGNTDVSPTGKLRIFISAAHCRNALDLKLGKTYLIMGSFKDIHGDQSSGYQYVLGEKTWIEYWPTTEECITQEHRARCVGLESLVEQQEQFGCLLK